MANRSGYTTVYKAWFPMSGSVLAFASAGVTFDFASASFVARLLAPGLVVSDEPINELAGRFAINDGLAVTVATMPLSAHR